MLIKKSKEQKEFLLKLKKEINDFLINFKKRYSLFPWNEINKIIKININKNEILKIDNKEYTVDELIKTINDIKSQLNKKMKPSYFNILLKSYIRDSMYKEKDELYNSYQEYLVELRTIFKQMDLDLRFCLDALKEINKFIKSESTNKELNNITKESEETEMIYDKNFILECMEDIMKDNDLLTEGANLEMTDEFKKYKSQYKECLKEAKKLDKAKEYDKAIDKIDEAYDVLEESKKSIKAIPSTNGSVIIGVLTHWLPIAGELIAVNIVGTLASGGNENFGSLLSSIDLCVRDCKGLYNKLKDKNIEDMSADDLNLYKNMLVEKTSDLQTYLKKYKECVKYRQDKEKKESKEEAKTESFEDNEDSELKELMFESLSSLYEDEDEMSCDDEEIFTEGANLEIKKIVKETKTEYKDLVKIFKVHVKRQEYEDARKDLKELNSIVDKSIKQIKSIEPTNASIVFGLIANNLIVMLQTLGMAIITLGFGAVIPVIKDSLAQNSAIARAIKEDNQNYDASLLDTYRNRLIGICEDMKRHIKMLESELKRKEAKTKKEAKAIKESAEIRDKKLAIYEACHNGEITIEEREELLKELNDSKYIESSIDENSNDSKIEKFESVKKALYERCSNGSITVEQREDLIQKAKDMILTEDSDSSSDDSTPSVGIDSAVADKGKEKVSTSTIDKAGESLESEANKMANALKSVSIKTN